MLLLVLPITSCEKEGKHLGFISQEIGLLKEMFIRANPLKASSSILKIRISVTVSLCKYWRV
jgi:hypothetical protein